MVQPRSSVATRGSSGRLGQLRLAGRVLGGRGLPGRALRRYPSFALTYITAGTGRYIDRAHDVPVTAGTLIHVFPGHPHWYGTSGGTWDETFLVFDGALFELASEVGILDRSRPVRTLLPVPSWQRRLDDFRTRRRARTASAREAEACELMGLLAEASAGEALDDPAFPEAAPSWFTRSRELLESHLDRRLHMPAVAEAVGMPYETWRRGFRERAGCGPGQYRSRHRLDAAAELLVHTSLSVREIAAALGYSDERHLIRRFRAEMGTTPRRFRDASF